MTETAGRLSERIRFEGRDEVRGDSGDVIAEWQLRFECWASVEPVHRFDGLIMRADARHSGRRWRLMVRDNLKPMPGMRIRWRDMVMLLTATERDPRVPGLTIIWAEDWAD